MAVGVTGISSTVKQLAGDNTTVIQKNNATCNSERSLRGEESDVFVRLACLRQAGPLGMTAKKAAAGGAATPCQNIHRPVESRRGRAACDRSCRSASGTVRRFLRLRLLLRKGRPRECRGQQARQRIYRATPASSCGPLHRGPFPPPPACP